MPARLFPSTAAPIRLALGTLAVGLATGIVRQTLMPVAVAVGMAATAKWGPGILVGITGTVI